MTRLSLVYKQLGDGVRTLDIHEAKTHLSKLVDAVLHGNEIVIAMAGKPVAKLSPIGPKRERRFGVLKGKVKIADDFDTPLPEDILNDFEN